MTEVLWSYVDDDGEKVWLEPGSGPDDPDLMLCIDGPQDSNQTVQAVWLPPTARAELAALLVPPSSVENPSDD